MPAYVWRCRVCGEEVQTDPKSWPALESSHRLVHRLEDQIRELTAALRAAILEAGFPVEADA